MGRIARALLSVLLIGPALLLLATCKNPLLEIVQYKVSRAGGDPNIEVSYRGVAVVAGSSVDIGSAQSGGTPRTATFTVANTGAVQLTLSGNPLVAIGGTDASSFSPATLPYKTIPPGANSSFSLEFSPTTVAVKTATLTIKSDDPDTGTYSLTLSGRGVAAPGPDIQVSQGATILDDLPPPPPFGFGARPGTTSDVTFTISNVGTPGATLILATSNSVTITGTDAAKFSVTTQPPITAIADGGSTTFTVRFSPLAVQSYSATMHITSNDADEPSYDVALTGSGQEPDIEVRQGVTVIADTTTYGTSLGSVKADGPNEQTGTAVSFTIHNTGTWPLAIAGVSLTGTDPSDFVLTNTTTSPVPVGGSTSFSVKFDPSSAPGAKTATVTIDSDVTGAKNPYTFDVTGTATFAPKVYWVERDNGMVRRANLNGSNMEPVLFGLSSPVGLAIDQTNNKMYISETGFISTAMLDGSGHSSLVFTSAPSFGVAIDSTYIFWASFNTGQLGRALLNGTGTTYMGAPGTPFGIAVDPSTNDLYWTNYATGAIFKGTKDAPFASGSQLISVGGVPTGIALDGTTIYWTNFANGGVFRIDMGQVQSTPQPHFIALDVADNLMFWTTYDGHVWRSALDGTGLVLIWSSGSRAYGIALDLVP